MTRIMATSGMILASLLLASSLSQAQVIGDICGVGINCPPAGPGFGEPGFDEPRFDEPGHRPDPRRREEPRRPGGPGRPGHGGDIGGLPGRGPDYGHSGDQRIGFVGRVVRNETLSLERLTGLSEFSDRGAEIESVEVILRDRNARAELALLADGFGIARESYPSNVVVLYPNRRLEIGRDFRRLDLQVRGIVFIDQVVIRLNSFGRPGPGPGPGRPGPVRPGPGRPGPGHPGDREIVLEGFVNRFISGRDQVDIASITGLRSYHGYRISEVIVQGRSEVREGSRVQLVSGFNRILLGETHLPGNFPASQRIFLNSLAEVGRGGESLVLQVDRPTLIERVRVVLIR